MKGLQTLQHLCLLIFVMGTVLATLLRGLFWECNSVAGGNHSEKELRTSCKCQVSVALVSGSKRQFVEPLFREAHLICAWLPVLGSDIIWECVVCGFLPDYWYWDRPLFKDLGLKWLQGGDVAVL